MFRQTVGEVFFFSAVLIVYLTVVVAFKDGSDKKVDIFTQLLKKAKGLRNIFQLIGATLEISSKVEWIKKILK